MNASRSLIEMCLTTMSARRTKMKYLTVFIVLITMGHLSAQPTFKWAIGGQSGTLDEFVQTVATDGTGNVYVAGSFEGTVDFDPGVGVSSLTAVGSFDAFMAKYSSAGALVWAKQIGGSGIEEIYAIVTDASGNVYVTGYFEGTADFNPDVVAVANQTSNGVFDAFFAKYSTAGVYSWANKIGSSTGDDFGVAIALDASANVYVGGIFTGTADFDPSASINNKTSLGGEDIFFGKYTTGGLLSWANAMGSTSDDGCRGITTVGTTIWISGYYSGTMDVDPSGTISSATGLGGRDGIFAQYNQSDGSVGAWGTIRGAADDIITSVAAVGTNVYTAGYFSGTASLFGVSGSSSRTSAGGTDMFVAKHDVSTMNITWFDTMGGTGDDGINLMALDPSGNVYITGYFENTVDFDPSALSYSLVSAGGYDAFGARINPTTGALVGVGASGSVDDEQGTSVAVDASLNIYLAEIYANTINVDFRGGVYNVTAAGSTDWLLVKYEQVAMSADPVGGPTGFSSAVTATTATISWTAAAGPPSGYIVTRKAVSAPVNTPTDGSTYTTGQTVNDFVVAYVGSGTSFGDTGLTAGTTYQYKVYSYNGAGVSINYLLNSPLSGSITTASGTPPTITSFTPVSGAVGTVVTITGTGFSTTASANVVYFGATKATPQTATATQLTVAVPAGATYQPITVTLNGMTAYSNGSFMPTFSGNGVIAAGSFSPAFTLPGAGTETNHTVVQDIDLDGKPDLLVAATGALSIYRNISSSGTLSASSFATKVDFVTGGGNNHIISIGDLDGDGKPDIMVAANTVASIFRNTSTPGTINTGSLVKTDLVTSDVRFGTIYDIDIDGKPDLVLSDYNSGNVLVYRNTNSPGSIVVANFGSPLTLATLVSLSAVAAGDIDKDGKPDLVTVGGSTMGVFRNTSTSPTISFATRVDFAAGGAPQYPVIGDLDADAKLDVVVVNANSSVSVFWNQATAGSISISSFATRVDLAAGLNSLSAAVADIDGDGKPDILSGTQANSGALQVFKNTGSRAILPKVDFAAGTNPSFGLAIADMDGDGRPDVAVPNNTLNTVTVLQNAVAIVTPPPTITSFNPTSGAALSAVTITGTNFNATAANNTVFFGAAKAAVTNATATQLTVTVPNANTYQPISVTNNGLTGYSQRAYNVTISGAAALSATSFLAKQDFGSGGSFPDGLATGDFDLDGKADVVIANGNSNNVVVYKNTSTTGTLAMTVAATLTAGTSPMGPVVADWDGDGKLDIIAPNPTSTSVSIYRNTTTGGVISFATKVDIGSLPSPRVIAVGDMDGDGKPDLAISNIANASVTVYRNLSTIGAPAAAFALTATTGTNPYGVALADITGDGLIDMIVANGISNSVSVFRNTSTAGSISFTTKFDFATASQPQMFAIADYDQDGKLDIAVSCPASAVISVLRNLTTTTTPAFAGAINLTAASNAVGIAVDDIDGDGKADIATENVNTNNISVFKNVSSSGAISFGTKFDFTTGGTPHYVMSITDMDGDGKKDLLVSNSGENTFSVLRNNITITTPEPVDQPTALVFSGHTTSAITVSFTAAASSPAGYIALRAAGAAPSADPADNITYTVGAPIGTGTVVALGTALTFTDTGLSPSTTYHYKIYSYNGSGSSINYRATSPLQGSSSTTSSLAAEPTAQPTNLIPTNPTNSSVTLTFTPASPPPAGYIAIRGPAGGAAPTFTPVDGTAYSVGAGVGTGNTVAHSGSGTTFNDTGLAGNTTYSYRVYSFNGSGSATNYLTAGPLGGTAATTNTAPTIPTAFGTITISNTLDLYSVRFLDASIAFAGGDGGTMLKTTDGGTSWSTVTVPSSEAIWNIFFTSTTTGLAVGGNGLIMRTNNGGTTWNLMTSPVTDALYASFIVPGTLIAYAVGDAGVVLKSTDGGTSWVEQTNASSLTTSYYNTVVFKSATEGFVGGPDGVIQTVDGGATWTDFSSDPILWYNFPSATVGYGVGSGGKIVKTTDGGANWVTQTSGITSTLWCAHFVDTNTGFAVGSEGIILKTVNGGTNWTKALEGATGVVYSIHFGSVTNGLVVGEGGYIAKAENETSPITITLQPKTTINYGATENVTVTIPSGELSRVTSVEMRTIGVVGEAKSLPITFQTINGTGGVYTGQIVSTTDANAERVGFKYWFVVEYDTRFDRRDSTAITYMYLKYTGDNEPKLTSLRVAPPGTKDASFYQLISIPLQLEEPQIVNIFGTPDKKVWRLYGSAPDATAGTKYSELTSGSVALGKGYWYITTKSSPVDLGSGTAYNAKVTDPFKLALPVGFNLIGNPYNFNVSWNGGAAVKELRSFVNGSFQPASVMEPLKGYYVDVETAGTYDIPLSGTFNGGRSRELRIEQNESSWELDLVIEQGGLKNEMGKIGMHPDATLGYDALDERVFPMPDFFKLASLSIVRPEAGRNLEQDYVPTTENEVWEFTLKEGGESSPVTLSWKPESIALIGRDLFLFDEEAITLIDMRTTGSYQTRSNVPLKIITGNPAFIKSQVRFGESKIGALYPNPARQGFFVPVAMARPGEVKVKVFDMKGVEIITQVHFVGEGMQNIGIIGLPDGLNGLYLVTTETSEAGRKVQKVIFR